MKLNKRPSPLRTHEGGKAKHIDSYHQLRRSVLSCLLWEQTFYENGTDIYQRIRQLVPEVPGELVSRLAVEARTRFNLRHVSLLLARELARHERGKFVGKTIRDVICRADELTEFLALYWKDGKEPLSKQTKVGLANAFRKFNEYQLAKYNRPTKIKLKDVLFMCHAKPKDEAQSALWKRLINNQLKTPDTWENALCGGADKQETFTRLLKERKLGYLALLRNLNNMVDSGVNEDLIAESIINHRGKDKVLPFRYVAAARACPRMESVLDKAMLNSLKEMQQLEGKTILLVDISGSMNNRLSEKSELRRVEAAAALAALIRGICVNVDIILFNTSSKDAPARSGMALVDFITQSLEQKGTFLGKALKEIYTKREYKRLIVITDEQSYDSIPDPKFGLNYMINIAPYRNGVGYGKWIHIDGFSENVITFLQEYEESF